MSKIILRRLLIYSLPSYFNKATSLILVPIYVLHLSVIEFGIFDLLLMCGVILRYVSHLGWGDAYMRFYREPSILNEDLTKTLLVFRIVFQFLLMCIIYSLIGLSYFSQLIFHDPSWETALLAITIIFFTSDYLVFYETRYRAENRETMFATLKISLVLLKLFFILIFFLYFKLGIQGIIWGMAISNFIILLIFLISDYHWILKGSFNLKILMQVLHFGLPLVPAGFAVLAINVSDRLMLNWLMPETEKLLAIGQYAMAMKFVSVITLLSAGFNVFWAPYSYEIYHSKKDAQKNFARIFIFYVFGLTMAMTVMLMITPWIYDNWLNDFVNGKMILPILMTSMLVYAVGDYFCLGISFKNQNEIRAYAGVLALLINLILNYILIIRIGILGAAWATLISNVVYAGILMIWSNKLFQIHYDITIWIVNIFLLAIWSFIYIKFPDKSLLYGFTMSFYLIVLAWKYRFFRKSIDGVG